MIIALDVDGVLADLGTEWLRRYNLDYGDTLTNNDITEWGIHKFVKCGVKIYEYIEDPTLYDSVLPIENSLVAVSQMKQYARVVFVTSSTVGAFGAKYGWLRCHGFLDNDRDYIECRDKSLVKANLLIDDYLENIKAFRGASYLFSQPWNKSTDYVRRIINWEHFINN